MFNLFFPFQSFSASSIGTCDSQEDRSIRVGNVAALCSNEDVEDGRVDHFIGVFDGHGGWEASDYVHDRIFHEVGRKGYKCDVEASLLEAFATVDEAFAEIADRNESKAGCTALACLVRDNTLWVANAGDCRAVISSRGRPEVLTVDHNVKNPDEVQAVIARGGTMLRNRINGVLSVTRALGNRMCRDLISQTPDITHRTIDWSSDDFLVIGSDGLFDNHSNENIINFVAGKQREIQETLRDLRAVQHSTEMDLQTAEAYLACSMQACADELIKVCLHPGMNDIYFLHPLKKNPPHSM